MENGFLSFFAETQKGEIIQFYNITFVLDNSLCAWVDQNIIKDVIYNYNAKRLAGDNLYVRTREVTPFYGNSSSTGYVTMGYRIPTRDDIPFMNLRSVWDELFLDTD